MSEIEQALEWADKCIHNESMWDPEAIKHIKALFAECIKAESLRAEFQKEPWLTVSERNAEILSLRTRNAKLEAVVVAGAEMVSAYDAADEAGLMWDHGPHDADLTKCPGCRCDVASEGLREALAALEGKP